ncbi:hypothetical protein DESC_310026 [Desulfosarcina cetonica]|nr:hypothetical protein DESC_310026 [Desulfosarcina cetonica]
MPSVEKTNRPDNLISRTQMLPGAGEPNHANREIHHHHAGGKRTRGDRQGCRAFCQSRIQYRNHLRRADGQPGNVANYHHHQCVTGSGRADHETGAATDQRDQGPGYDRRRRGAAGNGPDLRKGPGGISGGNSTHRGQLQGPHRGHGNESLHYRSDRPDGKNCRAAASARAHGDKKSGPIGHPCPLSGARLMAPLTKH